MSLFKRVYRLLFPDIGIEVKSLRISFDIVKDITQETNKSKIKIYNLAPETRKKIEVADLKCQLETGYEEEGGVKRIFVGSVVGYQTEGEQDVITTLTLSDGQTALRDSVFSLAYGPGVGGMAILKGIAAQMGVLLRVAPDVQMASYPNGYSYIGQSRYALDEICNAAGANWSSQNGELQVIMNGGNTGIHGLVFAASSGLLGSPKRIIKSAKKADKDTLKKRHREKQKKDKSDKKAGWKITTLLAPTVNPGDAVKVESKEITAWFRVESLKHKGDNYSGEWKTEMELIERLAYV